STQLKLDVGFKIWVIAFFRVVLREVVVDFAAGCDPDVLMSGYVFQNAIEHIYAVSSTDDEWMQAKRHYLAALLPLAVENIELASANALELVRRQLVRLDQDVIGFP